RTKRRTKQRGSDECGAEHRYRARKKHRFQSDDSRDQPERGAAQSERHVEKNGVGAHGEAPALRRSAPHRLNAEPGIDQRIAEPGERGPGGGYGATGGKPDEREASRFNDHAEQRDLGSAESVGQMTKDQARSNERYRERAKGEPDGSPSSFSGQQGAETDDC